MFEGRLRKGEIAPQLTQTVLDTLGIDIQLNGSRPWDPQIHNPRQFFRRVALRQGKGFGDTYVEGIWDCEDLAGMTERLHSPDIPEWSRSVLRALDVGNVTGRIKARLINEQRGDGAAEVAKRHYDHGNRFYELVLGPSMVYSCAYGFEEFGLDDLAQAQFLKLDMACRKLGLERGMSILDIGCGWGSFAEYAADNYGVSVFGIANSAEQVAYAQERYKDRDDIEIRLMDYHDLTGEFDAAASFGMFEHVGPKNYADYMTIAQRSVKPGRPFLLHTIEHDYAASTGSQLIKDYAFANSVVPAETQTKKARRVASRRNGQEFGIYDSHRFGLNYVTTARMWNNNRHKNWEEIQSLDPERYDERSNRIWDLYLGTGGGAFAARRLDVVQQVFFNGKPQHYAPYRPAQPLAV